jgi:SOS-response transcriptional repressor LexA
MMNALKLEYVATIRKLAETAKEKRFKALQDAIKHIDLPPALREEIVGTCVAGTHKAKGV